MARLFITQNFQIENKITIPCCMPDIDSIDEIIKEIYIQQKYITKTPVGKSTEGILLNGCKLMIGWRLVQNILYTAVNTKSVHAVKSASQYMNYLILPLPALYLPISVIQQMSVKVLIDDIHHTIIDGREIKENLAVTLSIDKEEFDYYCKRIYCSNDVATCLSESDFSINDYVDDSDNDSNKKD